MKDREFQEYCLLLEQKTEDELCEYWMCLCFIALHGGEGYVSLSRRSFLKDNRRSRWEVVTRWKSLDMEGATA